MTINVKWYNDSHSILSVHMSSNFTWVDFQSAIDKVCEELSTHPYRIDLILSSEADMPTGNPVPHLKSFIRKLNTNENIGLTVPVAHRNNSGFIGVMVELVSKILRTNLPHASATVCSMEEALAAIAADRTRTQATVLAS